MALNALKKFANECGIPNKGGVKSGYGHLALANTPMLNGIPNKGGVKSGYGHLALANTPMLKFESKYYDDVRKALSNTLEKDDRFHVFFRGINLIDSIKGLPPKGKYFTVCVEIANKQRFGQMLIANSSSIGI